MDDEDEDEYEEEEEEKEEEQRELSPPSKKSKVSTIFDTIGDLASQGVSKIDDGSALDNNEMIPNGSFRTRDQSRREYSPVKGNSKSVGIAIGKNEVNGRIKSKTNRTGEQEVRRNAW